MDRAENLSPDERAETALDVSGDRARGREGAPGYDDNSQAGAGSASGYGTDEKKPGKSKRRARGRLLIFLGAAILLAAIAWGLWWFYFARGRISTDDAFIDTQIIRIAPQEPGQLVAVDVSSNVAVKTGDVLARIDPAGPKAALAEARAAVAEADTGVASAEAALIQAQAKVNQSESAFQAADVEARNKQRTADRVTGVRTASGNTAVSQQQVDDAEAAAQSAAAARDEARTVIADAKAGVTAADAGVKAAKAHAASARAALDAEKVNMDHLTLTAPMDGQIVQVSVGKGSYVQPGQQIMALVPDKVWVTANLKETQLRGVRPGMPAEITVDAYPGETFHGKVVSIQRGAGQAFQLLPPQNATGNFVKVVQRVPVRISIDNPDPSKYILGPGMSAVPTIRTNQ